MVSGGGRILGVAGPPGVGKSTLGALLVEAWGPTGHLLPMDGFHFANEELARRGLAKRKGAPDTFDVAGLLATLQRVRTRDGDVLVPRFVREIEEPIANAIRIPADAELVVVEGNYLLLDIEPWSSVSPLLDARWLLELDDEVRTARLITRHETHGRSHEDAVRWVADVDEPNAQLIGARQAPPDLRITMP